MVGHCSAWMGNRGANILRDCIDRDKVNWTYIGRFIFRLEHLSDREIGRDGDSFCKKQRHPKLESLNHIMNLSGILDMARA